MGRISFYWSEEFKKRGYSYVHIGPDEIGNIRNRSLFAFKALMHFKQLKIQPTALIVHEPLSGYFTHLGITTFLESHGLERRHQDIKKKFNIPDQYKGGIKSRLFSFFRLASCSIGLRYSTKLLLSNSEDVAYVNKVFNRKEKDVFLFKNGVMSMPISSDEQKDKKFTVLFNASFIPRKGIFTLIEAATLIVEKGIDVNYLLIGTGLEEHIVREHWPENLQKNVQVVNRFDALDEMKYLSKASVFVLPSYFEGQPLSLLQAMSVGICSITTNCCGQKDIITHQKDGLLFEPGDHVALSKLILQVAQDDELRTEIGKKGKELVSSRTWENAAQSLVDYVEENSAQH
jgi:glycosyltransferase involved in cell wall biosynthesis